MTAALSPPFRNRNGPDIREYGFFRRIRTGIDHQSHHPARLSHGRVDRPISSAVPGLDENGRQTFYDSSETRRNSRRSKKPWPILQPQFRQNGVGDSDTPPRRPCYGNSVSTVTIFRDLFLVFRTGKFAAAVNDDFGLANLSVGLNEISCHHDPCRADRGDTRAERNVFPNRS